MLLQRLFRRFLGAKTVPTLAQREREQSLLHRAEGLLTEAEASRREVEAVTAAACLLRPGMTRAEALLALSGNDHPQVVALLSPLFPAPGDGK